MPTADQKHLRILVVATNTWPYPGRIAIALGTVGFQVAMICPVRSPAYLISRVGPQFAYRSWTPLMSIERAIKAWSPTLLVCTDDVAVRALHRIHRSASKKGEPESQYLVELIERSIGNAKTFQTTEAKSRLISLAQSLNVACPETTVVDNNHTLQRELAKIRFPALIKADGTWGGLGVRRVNTRDELLAAIPELLFPVTWPASIRRLIGKLLPISLLGRMRKWPRTMSIQKLIVGRPCNRAIMCWQGKVLAGVSVKALETLSEFGPATVIKIIDQPDMARAAERIAAKLNLSGFLGFDFILDRTNKAWLIEMNPRATPICHLGILNGNLSAAMFRQIAGADPSVEIPLVKERTIALFPGELRRSARSAYLSSSYHDLPSDQPEFVKACLRQKMKKSLGFRFRMRRTETLDQPRKLKNVPPVIRISPYPDE